MWLYEGHMGNLFLSDCHLSYDECYCEECGDSEKEIGSVKNAEDVLKLLADDIATTPEDGGWNIDYIMELLRANFRAVPTNESAIRMVLSNRTNSQ